MGDDVNDGGQEQFRRELMAMVEAMPAFPESVHRIMSMASDMNCSPKDLVSVIESDPVMTMKILKMVNSAFFSLSRHVASVQHALVYLGLNTIKNLAISIATVDALPASSLDALSMRDFLAHSLATASVAQRLARSQLHLRDGSDHFVGGLLHDFGKAVFIRFEPTTYAEVLRQARERGVALSVVEAEYFGVSNSEAGALLAESWQLPESLVEGIRGYESLHADASDLAVTIAAANHLVKVMAIGDGGNPDVGTFSPLLAARLGADAPTLLADLQDLPDEVAQIQGVVGG